MKIEIDDVDLYVEDIKQIIQYFDTLDRVNVNLTKTTFIETIIETLRDDKYIEYPNKLIYKLKNYESFIRSPKLI